MAKNTDIYNDQYLTEDENSDDERSDNFYKFISGQVKNNDALNEFFDDIGVDAKSDMPDLSEQHMQKIYQLLDVNGKKTMKTQYIKNIRTLLNRPNFKLVGGARKSKRKLKKTRKTRKNRTRILRKK